MTPWTSKNRHARDYWLDKQAKAAASLAKHLVPSAKLDLSADLETRERAREAVLLDAAAMLLLAEQMDRQVQRLKP